MDVFGGIGRMVPVLTGLALSFVGCGEVSEQETVGIYGYMVVGLEVGDPMLALTGGTFDAYDDDGVLLSEGMEPWIEDKPGYYRVRELDPESHVHLLSAANGDPLFVPTVRSAWTAAANVYAYDGEIYILEHAWLESTLVTLSEGGYGHTIDAVIDPENEANGGFVLGSMADPETWEGTTFEVVAGDTTLTTYYLDEDGVARPTLEATGPGGWFVVFDIPAGPFEVKATTAENVEMDTLTMLAFEDSCTSLVGMEVTF